MESGTKLGHYEISTLLGKGGMGEVWRARDTKLGREVAIKTLPEEFAKDADRLSRFEREARLLASLNHPNIAAIHGFEEDNGTHFLVLELVEGDTLADQLKRGAIPVEESLKLALQIAEALESAHEKGVIHRDLKPANIKVTPDGNVKVLDFGLAKAFVGDEAHTSVSNSPTLSMAATEQGVILGTAAYMSPEQASGEGADHRADVWAFGVVLFEMLTGRRLFTGKTATHVLASVLKTEPNWTTLPPNLHPRIRFLLERCLDKLAKDRLSSISDARVEVEKALAEPGVVLTQPIPEAAKTAKPSMLPWAVAVVLAVVAGAAGWILRAPEPAPVSRSSFVLPEDQQLSARTALALSPDGSRMVYAANGQLYLRAMDTLESAPISGTDENVEQPFFSPDGEWVGYWSADDGQLKKVAVAGGAPVTLCDSPIRPSGPPDWGTDDFIVWGNAEGVLRVSDNGGTPELLVNPEGMPEGIVGAPRNVQVLPGGDFVLFGVGTTRFEGLAVVQSVESGEQTVLFPGVRARYVPTGHIIYTVGDVLFAVPFDPATLEVTGGPVSMVEGVQPSSPQYAVSDSGTLVFVPGRGSAREFAMALVDRDGVIEPLNVPSALYRHPRVSPDGTQVAVYSDDDDNERSFVWVYDLSGDTTIRQLTFDGRNGFPIWTPDGEWITFASTRDAEQAGSASIYRTRADGSGVAERLTTAEEGEFHLPESYSGDGRLSLRSNAGGTDGVWTLLGEDGAEPEVFIDVPESNQAGSVFSPDGNWIAYHSNESGQYEIYVQPFPPTGAKSQITQTGGLWPLWSPDGSQLFFQQLAGTGLTAVDIETTPAVTFGSQQPIPIVTNTSDRRDVDIMPDGERFVAVLPAADVETQGEQAPAGQINIVQNWFEELKERVPVPWYAGINRYVVANERVVQERK